MSICGDGSYGEVWKRRGVTSLHTRRAEVKMSLTSPGCRVGDVEREGNSCTLGKRKQRCGIIGHEYSGKCYINKGFTVTKTK